MSRSINAMLLSTLIFAIISFGISENSVYAQEDREQLRLLTAMGNAEVRIRPDQAEVRLGVETEAPTATQAREQNAELVNRVIAAIRALGIPENNIQTSIFQLNPVRRFPAPNQTGEQQIVGYNVTNIVTVRTDQLDLIPRIIDEGIRAGANRIDAVNFLLRDERSSQQDALRQAIANAVENARSMASQLNVTLVQIQRAQQGGLGVVPPPIFYRAAGVAEGGGAPTPILPGEITVNASATVTYIIR